MVHLLSGAGLLEWKRHRRRRADRAPGRGRAGACPSSRLGRTGRFLSGVGIRGQESQVDCWRL